MDSFSLRMASSLPFCFSSFSSEAFSSSIFFLRPSASRLSLSASAISGVSMDSSSSTRCLYSVALNMSLKAIGSPFCL